MSGRWVVVLSGLSAVSPPGIDQQAYADACLADSYEVVAGMAGIRAGLAGDPSALEEIRWPEDAVFATDGQSPRAVADRLTAASGAPGLRADDDPVPTELIVVPGDVPDLPELIIAKIAKALARADVALAPDREGHGLAAAGVRLPWPTWWDGDLDLDHDPYQHLSDLAPRRNLVVQTPGWHRMRGPEAVHRLDPRLEGWDNVRMLLTFGTPS